ncbi:uncharacterized protein EV422DRAFT_623629 [Fimicolochytrium jonesii]|uniref:uncharacterized protein n=1 Tax=Fimicolochytrium jonesii TaxID=1396493 RepID=UPI0022FE4EAA|nr:uncharacterized protein EV422DRAFT_623629 [Fimicolochytrium jonesii]KAI8816122.1 hypothetical protein EV422DRAFT_623629 [Fimicolochytrium jonesii]
MKQPRPPADVSDWDKASAATPQPAVALASVATTDGKDTTETPEASSEFSSSSSSTVSSMSVVEGSPESSTPWGQVSQALQDKIIHHQEKRLLATAPPASGKSSMIAFLIRRLEEAQKQVFLLKMAAPKDEKAQRSALRGEFRCALYTAGVSAEDFRHMSYSTLLEGVLKSHDYVFIDDAQRW